MMESSAKRSKADDNEPPKSDNRGGVRRRIPLKMFGKKFSSKRLLVSSKVWMHTIPTQDCDIVLTLPASTSDTSLMWLLARLRSRAPQISVHFRHHSNSGIYGLYMTSSYESLLQGAEELGIRKPLKREYGGGMKEFVLEDQDCFEGALEERTFLNSQERQSIMNHMLTNLRATDGEELDGVRFVEGQPIVPRLLSKNVVSGVFPLHCQQDLMDLQKKWVLAFRHRQPLDSIMEYYGVKIGMYFAFLGHYTQWLVLPAVLGVALWLSQGTSQWWEDVSWMAFSIFNVFWATLYIINWKRTSAFLAYRWGTLDKKDGLLKDPRPLYKGDLHKSPVTGHMEPHYPDWKRNVFRYTISMPVIILSLFIVFYVMLLIFQLQEWVNQVVAAGDAPSFMRFGPKVLMAVVISLLDEVYKQVAIWLNNKENHRLQETHETNLVIKLVLFQFVNSFLALFYIAFYLRDMDRLRETLAALLITRQILGNIKEVVLPFLKWKGKLYSVGYKIASEMSSRTLDREVEKVAQVYRRKLCSNTPSSTPSSGPSPSSSISTRDDDSSLDDLSKDGKPSAKEGKDEVDREAVQREESIEDMTGALTQAEVESAMSVYDDAFEDYLEMCMQFGYVTLFSSAFPLAALCALLNNVIEIRSDAFKLCYTHQRPFGARVEDIGIWQDVLQVMVLIAVLVNSVLIGMGDLVDRMVPGLSDTFTILLVVIVEHAILLIKSAMEYAIPDVPSEVATEMAKVEFQRREALKRLEMQGPSGTERSPRSQTPDSFNLATRSTNSPVLSPRRSGQVSSSSPAASWEPHPPLVSHRPYNFNTNHPEDRQRGGNPWATSERGQDSPRSRISSGTSSGSPGRKLPRPPTDDRFRNPFESETQQIFRPPSDVLYVYRRSPDSGAGSSGSRGGAGPRPAKLLRARSLDSDLTPSRRLVGPSPLSIRREGVSLIAQRQASSQPREMAPTQRGGVISAKDKEAESADRDSEAPSQPGLKGGDTLTDTVDGTESCVDSSIVEDENLD